MANILVITGSSRLAGNSDLLADNFIKGAQSSGYNVEKYNSANTNFKPCIACEKCWTNNKPCIFDDDTQTLVNKLENADIIVLASPLYWYTFSAQLKLLLDKMYPLTRKSSPIKLKIKKSYLLSCCADKDKIVFNPIISTFKEISEYMGWEIGGTIVVSNVSKKGDVIDQVEFKKAYKLGVSITL